MQVPNPGEACEFYNGQFQLEVAGRDSDGTIRLNDGVVTLLLTESQVRPKNGVQYFGIQVAISERARGQIQLNDPAGNQVVISQNGWAN